MDVPIKVDQELYFEGKFDTEAMLNMLEKKVLEAATSVDHVPERDALEHEEQEQHAPVQTM